MGLRTWSRVLLTALGLAAAVGAGQLGFAYGLGIVGLSRDFLAGLEHQWPAQLAWVAWFAMVATVAGGLAAGRTADRVGLPLTLVGRAGLAAVAGIGAGIVAPLTMLPARVAQVERAIDPVLTVGLTAALGAVVGVVAATAALAARPLAWNITAIIGAAWAVALISVAPSVGPRDPLPSVRLGVLDLPSLAPGTTRALALIGIPALGLLAGAASAGVARFSGRYHPVVTATCGTAGPTMLALAYLLAGPGDAGAQAAPYWASVLGVAAGALGSLLAAIAPAPGGAPPPVLRLPPLPGRRAAARRTAREDEGQTLDLGRPAGTDDRAETAAPAPPWFSGGTRAAADPPAEEAVDVPAAVDPVRPVPRPRESAALTEPTPDPLTAPIELLRLGRRATRRRPEPTPTEPTPAESTLAESTPAEPRTEPPATSADPLWPSEPAPTPPVVRRPVMRRPVVPAPAVRPTIPTAAAETTAEPAADTGADRSAAETAPEPAPEPAAETAADASPPAAEPARARRSLLGLRRRGRQPAPSGPTAPERLAPGDEEYVDWVSGLGEDRPRRPER
jgi:hypothetical protein